MKQAVTVLAPIKLAAGKTEADLIAASNQFQTTFVSKHAGVLRRELIKTGDGEYTDIIQFRSQEDAEKVMAAEAESTDCQAFFSLMDMSEEVDIRLHPSLVTYYQEH